MLAPLLRLITGPATQEAAKALDPKACERCDVNLSGECCSLCPIPLDFEVRDFWRSPLALVQTYCECGCEPRGIKEAVQLVNDLAALKGGTKLLVRQVLKDQTSFMDRKAYREADAHAIKHLKSLKMPLRLAILADPAPPEMLVELVRAWGGSVLWCEEVDGVCRCVRTYDGLTVGEGPTWGEALRGALEVAPCRTPREELGK